jgi:hypothetical protein
MDPGRRELYVEGVRDRAFLNWLAGDALHVKCAVIPIDLVEMPEVGEGGNRERLKNFLQQVASEPAEIRGLIDADQAVFIPEALPSNAWATDLRDVEGYVLAAENVDAALRLGCGIERVAATSVIGSMNEVARTLAAIRLVSERLGLKLPVSSARLNRYVRSTRDGALSLNRRGLISGLMQAAGVTLRRTDVVVEAVEAAESDVSSIPLNQALHGKDCMRLLTLQFRGLGVSDITDVTPLLWTSFRRGRLEEFPVLSDVVAFLTKA